MSHVTFLSAGFRMSDGSFPSNSARNICVKTAKKLYKNKKKRVVFFKIYKGKAILDVSLHPKRLNFPLKTLNESLEKSK